MSDYKEMYLKMVRASGKAINLLIEAQRECEEMYLSGQPLTVFPDKEKAPEPEERSGADGQRKAGQSTKYFGETYPHSQTPLADR